MANWYKFPDFMSGKRRKLLGSLAAVSGLAVMGQAPVANAQTAGSADKELRFPGDPPENFLVYQFNKADDAYQKHVLFSAGAVLRKYGDNIKIVITAFGPGIHILLKKPQRPVSKIVHDTVSSLNDYGVEFHACGNTLTTLKLTRKDIVPFAKYVDVGAADLMELQKHGYAYVSW
ncbi:MAG: DsrE family protein [Acidiferrobacterales bacterium]